MTGETDVRPTLEDLLRDRPRFHNGGVVDVAQFRQRYGLSTPVDDVGAQDHDRREVEPYRPEDVQWNIRRQSYEIACGQELELGVVVTADLGEGLRDFVVEHNYADGTYRLSEVPRVAAPPEHVNCRSTVRVEDIDVADPERRWEIVRRWALYLEGEVRRRGVAAVRRDLAQTEILRDADQVAISIELDRLYDPRRGTRRTWTRAYGPVRRVLEL